MKVSDYIASFLHAQGIKRVFVVPGGMLAHLLDSIHLQGQVRLVGVHHEQSAAFAADAVGRITGMPGVALATSGPGATNLLTGIGSCYFDSTPALFITGQVNRDEQRGALPIRQLGFQETDVVAMARPITKAAWSVESPEQVPTLLAQAYALALSGRPGPVLLDVPMDVQGANIPATPSMLSVPAADDVDENVIEEMLSALSKSQRPLILAGGGIRSAKAGDRFRELVETIKLPVVNSLMAVDALPYNNPLRVGMIGTYGNRWANKSIGRADFLLVLGSRLDIRQTGSETDAFKGDRTIYHVDCEAAEINKRVKGCRAVVADLHSFLIAANRVCADHTIPECSAWLAEIAELRRALPDTAELRDVKGINPNEFMHQLSAASSSAAAFVADVGQHQMWAAQSLELTPAQRFLTSGGMGAMGFGLPSAIGAAFACVNQPVVMIAGDGGFQLNIQELETIVRNRLPIKMVIVNNRCHGMIRQFQQSYFNERYPSSYWDYSTPDFARVAEAYGISAHTIDDPSDVREGLGRMWRDPYAPFLLQVMVDTFVNAFPKIAFGRPITEMEPDANPIALEGT